MKNKTIYLEAEQKKDCLTVSIREKREPELPIFSCEDRSVSAENMALIENRCRETIEILNRKGRKAGECSGKLKQTGLFLCDELLTHDIKKQLRNTDAEYLILKTDNHLVHIPWELIYLDNKYLCERFNMGRMVKTRQRITGSDDQYIARPLKMWILANPGGDLDSAALEGDRIVRDTDSMNPDEETTVIEADLDSEITADAVKSRIRNYDFIHFAGHFHYDSEDPGQSGWKLAHGNLTARDVDNMAGTGHMPVLVFSNACQSARTEEWGKDAHDSSFGLANAFLRAGVQYYVGSFWEIMDRPGSLFAREFYRHLISGRRIGQAVRLAREMLRQQYPSDFVGWASYVLYGDPGFRCFRCDEKIATQENPRAEKCERTVSPVRSDEHEQETDTWNGQESGKDEKQAHRKNKTGTKKFGNILAVFLIIIVLAAASVFLADQINGHITRNALQKHAIEKQNEISELIKQITVLLNDNNQNTPLKKDDQHGSDNWTSGPLTVTVDTGSPGTGLSLGKENMILSQTMGQIIDNTDFSPLERERFVIILREIRQDLALKSYEKRRPPELMSPQYFLFLTVRKSWSGSEVFVRLADKKSRVLFAWEDTLQKYPKKLLQNLNALKTRFPLRGIISEIKERQVILNIGSSAGVRAGQLFRVVGKDVILEIESFGENRSTGMIKKGEVSLEKGLRVEAM